MCELLEYINILKEYRMASFKFKSQKNPQRIEPGVCVCMRIKNSCPFKDMVCAFESEY